MAALNRSRARRRRSNLSAPKVLALMALGLFTAPALSAEVGDIGRGRSYAERVCAECHAVEPSETKSPRPDAAPFSVISRLAGLNATALTVFLQTSHSEMPNLVVVGQDRDDLIAYIISLRP